MWVVGCILLNVYVYALSVSVCLRLYCLCLCICICLCIFICICVYLYGIPLLPLPRPLTALQFEVNNQAYYDDRQNASYHWYSYRMAPNIITVCPSDTTYAGTLFLMVQGYGSFTLNAVSVALCACGRGWSCWKCVLRVFDVVVLLFLTVGVVVVVFVG